MRYGRRPGFGEIGMVRSIDAAHSEHRDVAVSVEEAKEIILNSIVPLSGETISIMEACDRILCEDIIADVMIPLVDDSAMDGYAIVADDTLGASRNNPVKLRVVGEIQAGGSTLGKRVSHGTAIRIMTGAPVPPGADSIVQFEDTEERAGYVTVFGESARYRNYKRAGESIRKGDKVLQKGNRLRPADIGILAALNHSVVKVYKQPTVSIVSTGDELAEIGEEIRTGQIRNINAYTLYSEARKCGALPRYLGIAKDTLGDTKEKLRQALESDVVISTGGVSTGKYDFVKEVYADLDIEILFEWVNVKPGRPCTFGKRGDRIIFGLPGHPVPVLTSFIQFVKPALLRTMGAAKVNMPVVSAVIEEDLSPHPGCVNLLRGSFTIRNGEFYVSTTGSQKPSMLRSMSRANCLIAIPENSREIKAGEKVTIQLIEHDEV